MTRSGDYHDVQFAHTPACPDPGPEPGIRLREENGRLHGSFHVPEAALETDGPLLRSVVVLFNRKVDAHPMTVQLTGDLVVFDGDEARTGGSAMGFFSAEPKALLWGDDAEGAEVTTYFVVASIGAYTSEVLELEF